MEVDSRHVLSATSYLERQTSEINEIREAIREISPF